MGWDLEGSFHLYPGSTSLRDTPIAWQTTNQQGNKSRGHSYPSLEQRMCLRHNTLQRDIAMEFVRQNYNTIQQDKASGLRSQRDNNSQPGKMKNMGG